MPLTTGDRAKCSIVTLQLTNVQQKYKDADRYADCQTHQNLDGKPPKARKLTTSTRVDATECFRSRTARILIDVLVFGNYIKFIGLALVVVPAFSQGAFLACHQWC